MQDFYSVLQVAPQAGDAEIKAAFRHLAKSCHPDVKPDDREAEEAFQEARRAYQVLSNPETRKVYDKFLADRRALARVRSRRAVTTMVATFLLTAATVPVALLLLQEHGHLLAWRPDRSLAAAVDVARAATAEAAQAAKAEAEPSSPIERAETVRRTPPAAP
jgi:curved DNA-binding protein CbpA